MSRYLKREKATNDKEQYDKLFEKRGIRKVGLSYEKLASEFYGNPKHWWVIASFNRKPTESHVEMGETIRIPKSLADALRVVS